MSGNKNLWIIDSTLRDGEQAPGVVFSRKEKLRLAGLLNDVGVDEIEAGIPAMGEEVIGTIRRMARLKLDARIMVWSRALRKDIDLAAQTNADAIHIAFPLSDIQLSAMGKEWRWVKENVPAMVEYASRYFRHVSVGAQDASRCGDGRLVDFIGLAVKANACRLRIADTVGFLTPLATMDLLHRIRDFWPSLDIDFHAHNDLGMATANSVTAWQSGAKSISVTVNGLGERAGNASLEEFLMAVSMHGGASKYDTSKLYSLCRYVSEISGRPIPPGKAVCGQMAFSHESGIHASATCKNPLAFQLYNGEEVGREISHTLFGTHSGTGALKYLLEQHHIFASDTDIYLLKREICRLSRERRTTLSPSEILRMQGHLSGEAR